MQTKGQIPMSQEVDPITLQVVGGALHSIAEQMGNVLYRMSYSSIIRESQDLGAGLFDTQFQTLCESDSTPMHIGSLPGYLRGIEKFRRQPLAGHRHRDASVLRGRTGRLLGEHGAPRRYRRGDTRPDHRRAGHVCRGHADEWAETIRGGKA
jgi:Hydantoinase B/oxoprolinase